MPRCSSQPPAANVVISTDLLVEDIDFRHDTTTPNLLGHKALAVSLSDIAAMGARPRWAMLSLGLQRMFGNPIFSTSFYEGFFQLADRYGVKLIGGDVSRTPDKTVIDSMVDRRMRRRIAQCSAPAHNRGIRFTLPAFSVMLPLDCVCLKAAHVYIRTIEHPD